MAEVTLEKVSKRFGEVVAVDAVDLRVADGELLVLVGPSGCGKSTTLRLVAGLEDLSSGTIRIGERDVSRVAPKDRDIAMVFQNYALYPHMNVYKNMAFGLKMRRVPRADIDRRVREAAELLDIEPLLRRKPGQLSGGQRQRVALGRAIVRDPAVFLFDEPLSNLDAKLRVGMRTELSKLHQRLQTTTIHVTHDQVEAMMLGDRIVVMHEGRIQQVGKPLEVYETPSNRFVAEFIGSPPMNFFHGRLAAGAESAACTVQVGDWNLPLPPENRERYAAHVGREVVLGLRSEHVVVGERGGEDQTWTEVPAQVDVVQLLGAETILELSSSGDRSFAARVDSGNGPSRNDRVTAWLNMSKAHLFDAETERVIR